MSAFRTYWISYGRCGALLTSPYLWISFILWGLLKPIWYDGAQDDFYWRDISISILPSMVSFSLGALAIFLAFSNEKFLKLLRQRGSEQSYLLRVTAAFFHFIIVQFVALFATLLLYAYPTIFVSGASFFVFLYALACGVAAAAALLDMAEILNAAGKLDE